MPFDYSILGLTEKKAAPAPAANPFVFAPKPAAAKHNFFAPVTKAPTSNPLFDSVTNVTSSVGRSSRSFASRTGLVEPPPPTTEEQVCSLCPTMTFKQRLIAVITCCVLGYVLEIAGSLTLLGGASPKNLRTFAVLYVLGNVVAIMATIFWVGPKFMCKQMFKRSRRCAAVFYLFMLVTVIVLACLKVHVLIVLTALVVEIFSAVWYSASYLPKGRWLILQCCKMSCFKPCPEILAPVERSLPII